MAPYINDVRLRGGRGVSQILTKEREVAWIWYWQGEGGGPKSLKFRRRHMYMPPKWIALNKNSRLITMIYLSGHFYLRLSRRRSSNHRFWPYLMDVCNHLTTTLVFYPEVSNLLTSTVLHLPLIWTDLVQRMWEGSNCNNAFTNETVV